MKRNEDPPIDQRPVDLSPPSNVIHVAQGPKVSVSGNGPPLETAPPPAQQTKADRLAERNRRNAQKSTGPRTAEGKEIARRNSIKHGLCANPASGDVESSDEFIELHQALTDQIGPRGVIEAHLVHRIAQSIWRLQRATKIDAALGSLAITATNPDQRRVQDWIERIQKCFEWQQVEETDPRKLQGVPKGEKIFKYVRPGLMDLDDLFQRSDSPIRKDSAALEAMGVMLRALREKVRDPRSCYRFHPADAQVMAWLLGESAQRLAPEHINPEEVGGPGHTGDGNFFPDEQTWRSRIDELIGLARLNRHEPSRDLPLELASIIDRRLATFEQWRHATSDPDTAQHANQMRIAALLPDEKTLNRFIRYEVHSERALQRALETLARIRGVAIETVMARVTRQHDDGTTVEVQGQQTRWRKMKDATSPESGFCETNPD